MTHSGSDDEHSGGFASPPCFMHELEEGSDGMHAVDRQTAVDVARWRKGERARLIEARLAMSSDERRAHAAVIAQHLDQIVGDVSGQTVSLYWPFRGEPDLREWGASVIARGGRLALPVVAEKARPLVFRSWAPGEKLERGIWNIPVPAGGEVVFPDITISPLVGFDGSLYRLGYGGGYYDRTLASLPKKPFTVGVGYEIGRLATIYPQPHDIPMDAIATESGTAATAA